MASPELPPTGAPEITPRVLLLGVLLAVVMGAANVYVGLKVGMTVSASIPAAVMAMLAFRYLFRSSSILEANQVQTCASAGESLAAGIIFTMPALVIMGTWTEFDFWTVTAVSFTGGLLGILFMIPMRKVFIADSKELPYPEGIACAAVLRSSEEASDASSRDSAQGLILGGLMGAAFKVLASFAGLIHGTMEAVGRAGDRALYFGSDVSPMLVAVGYIVRLNVAVLLFLGGALGWLVIMPLLGGAQGAETLADHPWNLWEDKVRYIGVGAMVVGGIASIISVRKGLVAAIKHLAGGALVSDDARERDLPSALILGLILASIAAIAFLYHDFTGGDVTATAVLTVVMLVAAFFFSAVASYIVGLVGNSNSPVSGMTITAVLLAGGVLYLIGFEGKEAAAATIGVAAIVCCVACTSGDVCNDLKTGVIVGASPIRQQSMQILGVAVASFVMAPTLMLLEKGTEGGIGGAELSAPQASLFADLARGFSGESDLPWGMIQIGVAIGLVILAIDAVLKARSAAFRAHLMPIAVGIYLPFSIAPPILLGGILSWVMLRGASGEAEQEARAQRGVLFSSGVIAGEALVGVALAGVAVAGLKSLDLGLPPGLVTGLTWVAIAAGVAFFVRRARP